LATVQKFTIDGKRIPVTKISLVSKGIFKAGDFIKVTGFSKGKGFAGVVKRWGFKGGPKTHGQSDRQRAPGSIGQTTTPGRVYRGKKMAGRLGGRKVTLAGLTVMEVNEKENLLLVKGLLPGVKGGPLVLRRAGESKKFVSLMGTGQKEIQETAEEKEERLRREKEAEEKLKQEEKNAQS
jgi:50S ribosomal protein uL3